MEDKNQKAIEIYDIIAEDYAKKFDSIESSDDLIFLDTFLTNLNPGMAIIDLGCGTGFSAGYFSKKGMGVEGVDLSTSMIKIARLNYPTIKFSTADMRHFFREEKVDAVWAGYSLFHFEQEYFENTIEKIKTYLKSGGIFALVMQEGQGEIEIAEPFLPEKKIYIHLYTEGELISILEKHGFEIIDKKIRPAADYEFSNNKILLISRLKNNYNQKNIKL